MEWRVSAKSAHQEGTAERERHGGGLEGLMKAIESMDR